jgi:two-component system response regulator YesN
MNLLIVDDELWSRRLIHNLLPWKQFGITQIFEAENGTEALQCIENSHIDLMITDMRMPGMDGAMLLEYVYDHGINIEIIAMSGYEDYKYLHAALKTKAIDYLLKPVVKEELQTAVLTGINRINKQKSLTYMETMLRHDDVKDELNHYHELKINLLSAVHQMQETEIIDYANRIVHQFFRKRNNPSLISFILLDLKRAIMELEQEYELALNYDVDMLPEDIEETFMKLAIAIHNKQKEEQVSILNVQKYISSHISETLSLSMLADAFFVSKEHLSRIFKKEVGSSVQQYITSKKIEYAKTLLRNHERIAISTISYMCGYTDLQYFYRVFKKKTGMTPLQYRDKNQYNPTTISI